MLLIQLNIICINFDIVYQIRCEVTRLYYVFNIEREMIMLLLLKFILLLNVIHISETVSRFLECH
jgi:hypothetical protein